MKFKNLFLLLFLTIAAISCKDEAKKDENGLQNEVAVETSANTFKVTLDLVAKSNDDFCLLYTQDGSLDFKDGIWKEVKGSINDQTIEFSLPENVFPTQLRMDFGKNQDEILLKTVKFDYNGKTREIKGFETGVFFRADASKCSYDATMGIIKALVKDGKKEAISLYPNEAVMKAELPKLK
ncbi:hypothetical protein [Flavobacterium sp.]|jgi:hypothetical protein|uniref:hypothetical protein n=1 Tax=Flavobacterium sp. TaxID=239 RepID=UPI0037BEA006